MSLEDHEQRIKALEAKVFGVPAPAPTPPPTPTNKDRFGTTILNTEKVGGPSYESTFDNGKPRTVNAVSVDPTDPILMIRGSGKVEIDGKGIAKMSGDQPRMYFTKQDKSFTLFKNTEVTFYCKRVSDQNVAYAGAVAALRSKHYVADGPGVNTVYARMRNDGKAQIEWEQDHPDATNLTTVTQQTSFPKNVWVGYKYTMKNLASNKILYTLHEDKTDGLNGGDWKQIIRYEDTDANRISRLANAVGCVFIRNTGITEWLYKKISMFEIE